MTSKIMILWILQCLWTGIRDLHKMDSIRLDRIEINLTNIKINCKLIYYCFVVSLLFQWTKTNGLGLNWDQIDIKSLTGTQNNQPHTHFSEPRGHTTTKYRPYHHISIHVSAQYKVMFLKILFSKTPPRWPYLCTWRNSI